MKTLQQDVMCALLQTLLDKELITQDIHDKSRSKILDTLANTEYFCCVEDNGKEDQDGYT